MKNIHILSTNNPSRFYVTNKDKYFIRKDYVPDTIMTCKNLNIYITSDEKIEIGDKSLLTLGNGFDPMILMHHQAVEEGYLGKKIILTTDPNLIEQGVQPIEDDFLNWFVKNPNCEFVEVYNNQSVGYEYSSYAMIIPEKQTALEWFEKEQNNLILNYQKGFMSLGRYTYLKEKLFEKAQDMDKENSLKLIELTAQLTGVATVDGDIAKMSYEDVYNQFKSQKNENG